MSYGFYPRYISVAEKKAKADRKLKQLKKKYPNISPIVIEGRAIARTWWGKAWNVNLERYADYSNRIGRGRSYVRHSAVLDLQIEGGLVTSLVQGTMSKPYEVDIRIDGIEKEIWQNMIDACAGKLDSLPKLLAGKLPRGLGKIFTAQGKGLFPSPDEIDFSCSCPDWASMCKHVAATLYGIGARLDEDPLLFFKLREVSVDDLISRTVKKTKKKLLRKAKTAKADVIPDSDVSALFGIEMDEPLLEGAGGVAAPDSVSANSAVYEPVAADAAPSKKKTKTGKVAKKAKTGRAAKRATPGKTAKKVKTGKTAPGKAARGAKRGPKTKRTAPPTAVKTSAPKKTAKAAPSTRAPKRTPRPVEKGEGREASVDAMVRLFLQRFDLPTRRDLEKIDDRMDRLEKLIAATDFGAPTPEIDGDESDKKAKKSAPSSSSGALKKDDAAVFRLIRGSRQGIDVAEIRDETSFKTSKIRYIITKLMKAGRVQRVARGRFSAL